MKVSELISLLKKFPPDSKVITNGEVGGFEDVEAPYETVICDNHASLGSYLFGMIRRDANSPATYRLVKQVDTTAVGVEVLS